MKFLVIYFLVSFSAVVFAETNSEVLSKIWTAGKEKSCSQTMRSGFNDVAYANLKSQIKNESDRAELARIVNPFLFSFGYSHTEFFTQKSESYYLFKSYYAEVNPAAPAAPLLVSPGVQVGQDSNGYYVKEALDGFAAKKLGLAKGDRILKVDGNYFMGQWGTEPKADAIVNIMKSGRALDVHLPLLALNWSQTFQDATLSSIQIKTYKNKKIGYVHLWSGVHPQSAEALWQAVKKFKDAQVDGVILDLRGGYGGAFWWHLDPFFSDRKDFFKMSATDGDGKTDLMVADPQENPNAYLGPMAVLIDEGARSGKEAMAYQFRKTKRAVLIGVKTPGYFSGGGLFFMDEPLDYMLYLCVRRDSKLDGVDIEGVGVKPDLELIFDADNDMQDSQLKRAFEYF